MRRHSIGMAPVKKVQQTHGGSMEIASSGSSGSADPKKVVVAVRVRPLSAKEKAAEQQSCTTVLNGKIVAIRKEGDPGGYLKSQLAQISEYGFDAALDQDCSQEDVYDSTLRPFVPNLLEGLNVTVFAYGATGAGKTHTMLGSMRADESASNAEAGIIPQAVYDVFSRITAKREQAEIGERWDVSVSFVEIYNEQVYDLLNSSSNNNKPLQLREVCGTVTVAGVNEVSTQEAENVLSLLELGNKQRKTEETGANSVLQLTVKRVRQEAGRECIVESKLSLIDLAGSERASATNNRGVRLHEGANINKSLLALANCINTLASNSAGGKKLNVKYRDSRLTHLLKSSLEGGNCNLVMIANINPSHVTFEDSHNTLKYANRAKNIKVCPVANSQAVESSWLDREKKLREENAALRQDNAVFRARVLQLESLLNGNNIPFAHLPVPTIMPAGVNTNMSMGMNMNTIEEGVERRVESKASDKDKTKDKTSRRSGAALPVLSSNSSKNQSKRKTPTPTQIKTLPEPKNAMAQTPSDQSASTSGSQSRLLDAAIAQVNEELKLSAARAEAEAVQVRCASTTSTAAESASKTVSVSASGDTPANPFLSVLFSEKKAPQSGQSGLCGIVSGSVSGGKSKKRKSMSMSASKSATKEGTRRLSHPRSSERNHLQSNHLSHGVGEGEGAGEISMIQGTDNQGNTDTFGDMLSDSVLEAGLFMDESIVNLSKHDLDKSYHNSHSTKDQSKPDAGEAGEGDTDKAGEDKDQKHDDDGSLQLPLPSAEQEQEETDDFDDIVVVKVSKKRRTSLASFAEPLAPLSDKKTLTTTATAEKDKQEKQEKLVSSTVKRAAANKRRRSVGMESSSCSSQILECDKENSNLAIRGSRSADRGRGLLESIFLQTCNQNNQNQNQNQNAAEGGVPKKDHSKKNRRKSIALVSALLDAIPSAKTNNNNNENAGIEMEKEMEKEKETTFKVLGEEVAESPRNADDNVRYLNDSTDSIWIDI